ncbi:LysR substrate-binding domain-containing protein [Methylocella sp. CPCC 101449]|uniref:LysR substrate-binding domain-containing protein n=1 Tax=Methylocella sp. CPCC 101449 TaxID=2987531 RepID=UPI00288DCB0C|nr:LysR substrate-binding domain-containing protein [Methylocella sp. CPCC 101449]MDT2020657.1 LysR substrate-binding domain-containing protein [Methylocella sp. CPCC 101449]
MNALLAFEATARHESITRAANELSLTESAVSRQISLLEDHLSVRLFNRVKKRLSLTRAGRAYANDISRALERLERDTLKVMSLEGAGGNLEIAALPTVGSSWLVPRLSSFYEQHPDVTINVSARSERFLFDGTDIDGALCFGDANWPGALSDFLFEEDLVPVASPKILTGRRSGQLERLIRTRMLHLKTRPGAWQAWCLANGLSDLNFMSGPRFEIQAMLIGAACAGQGVALLPEFLIEAELRSGALKILSDKAVRSKGAYYFAYPEWRADEPLLKHFRTWLQDQVRLFRGSDD